MRYLFLNTPLWTNEKYSLWFDDRSQINVYNMIQPMQTPHWNRLANHAFADAFWNHGFKSVICQTVSIRRLHGLNHIIDVSFGSDRRITTNSFHWFREGCSKIDISRTTHCMIKTKVPLEFAWNEASNSNYHSSQHSMF